MSKHQIPLGTRVSFEGDPQIYETCDYQTLLSCQPGCQLHEDPLADHECLEEPHICVRKVVTTSKPLSQLKTIFDQDGPLGRPATPEEREPDV